MLAGIEDGCDGGGTWIWAADEEQAVLQVVEVGYRRIHIWIAIG